MANIPWSIERNLERSLEQFLKTAVTGTTVFYKGVAQPIDIRVGNAPQDNWAMPVISIYADSELAPREFVGSNKRLTTYLMIIDVRALDGGMRSDLKDWLVSTINDGFTVYTYTPNALTPDSPTKVLLGKASIDFLSNTTIRNTQDLNIYEKYRQNISISVTISL
ncbi:hypothetical protein LCGC14_2281820 [marine sediment metagenome]|uniref:Uncharacterized protein n=1 Tax=marine sediment metagenome TaxID=412755 RepID=A0A0F9CTU4_9ZZZZ